MICYTTISEENPAYFLEHEDNVICENAHIFDEPCTERIKSCPFCRTHNFYPLLVPTDSKEKSFYEKYRTNAMGDLAASPALMVGLERVSSAVFSYIPIDGLGNFIGGSTALSLGGYVALLGFLGAVAHAPLGCSSQESLVNGVAILAGLAVTHVAFGFNGWGAQSGASLLLISAIASVVFSRLKSPSSS